jgi:5'-methylthioadenosine phosphorylase
MAYVLGVVGGSGIYDLPGLERVTQHELTTPYGSPSAPIVRGELAGTVLLFLPRHGAHHQFPPHQINYRANICALKQLGATHLVSLSAVGSMREEIAPGHVVVVDQYMDLTKRRISTFFEDGIVGHVAFAEPVCPELAAALAQSSEAAGARVHRGGTYLCMEGPQFSTRAESLLYRQWGVSVIGMTAMPEAKLAREAELPYATLALATDYDCWHESEADVDVQAILAVLKQNADLARRTVAELSARLPPPEKSPAFGATRHAILTPARAFTAELGARLSWLLGERLLGDRAQGKRD